MEEIKIPFLVERPYQATKELYLHKTISNLTATLAFGFSIFFEIFTNGLRFLDTAQSIVMFTKVMGTIGLLIFVRRAFKVLNLYIRYRDIAKDIQKIGEALLSSLIKIGMIRTERSSLSVVASHDSSGSILCHVEGGTTFEKSSFINALQEIIAPVDNPRYFIVRKALFMNFLSHKDYHTVPKVLSRNEAAAISFKEEWGELVGSCDLIFARTIEGRKILLKSRITSLAAQLKTKLNG